MRYGFARGASIFQCNSATRRVLTCRGLAGASPAPSFPGAVANPVHFFGTKERSRCIP